jgi:hypothetical protein
MGLSGSSHMKVLGDCYDLKEGKEYTGNLGSGLLGCLSFIFFCAFMAASVATKFENGIIIGLMLFFGFYTLYEFTLGPIVSKWMFARKNGKRVPCPAPKSDCDDEYKRYVKEGRSWVYECDERLKYN